MPRFRPRLQPDGDPGQTIRVRLADVRLLVLAKDADEANGRISRDVEIQDAIRTALPAVRALATQPDLAEAAGARDLVPLARRGQDLVLEPEEIVFRQAMLRPEPMERLDADELEEPGLRLARCDPQTPRDLAASRAGL